MTCIGRAARSLAAGNAAGDVAAWGHAALPVRKRLDHRGPLSIDVSAAWYFITICAEGHAPPARRQAEGRDLRRGQDSAMSFDEMVAVLKMEPRRV